MACRPHRTHRKPRPDAGAVCPSPQMRRRRTSPSAGYSACMRAAWHGVGHGVGTKPPSSARRRAYPQFWQRSAGLPRHARHRPSPAGSDTAAHHAGRNRAVVTDTGCPAGYGRCRPQDAESTGTLRDRPPPTMIPPTGLNVSGSTQMSKPGSSRVSAEDQRAYCDGRPPLLPNQLNEDAGPLAG